MNSTNVTSAKALGEAKFVFGENDVYTLFGDISLWSYFDRFCTYATGGRFVPREFRFVQGELPLSELPQVLCAVAIYYVVIFGGRFLLKNSKPVKLEFLSQVHNLFLTTISFILFVLLVEQVVPIIYKNGLFFSICHYGAWTQPLVTLYYLNYLVKFYEFLDTVFLVLKHKNLTFLHTYHHGATAFLCYSQLVGNTSVSWVPIVLNLAVHCLMYFYYFLSSRGIRVWWKEWVTRLQIVQFVLDLVLIYVVAYHKTVNKHFKFMPSCGECYGSGTATFSGFCVLSSYLFLFLAFYIEVYKIKGAKKAKGEKKN